MSRDVSELYQLIDDFSASQEGNYRTAAYEAINSYIKYATSDTINVVHNVAITAITRMEQLMAMQVCGNILVSTYSVLTRGRTKYWASMTGITGTTCRATSVRFSNKSLASLARVSSH